MKRFNLTLVILALSITASCNAAQATTIEGAGATFPFPLYTQWDTDYNKVTGVRLYYQGIGSGGGIKKLKTNTIDFGASDVPLTAAALDQAGLMQFPMAVGAVVPVVHLKGIKPGQLKLTASNLANIYLGKITQWNDSRIKKNNPDLNLPNKNILTVHRADRSGTTWIFTNYLSKVSREWAAEFGQGQNSIVWPGKQTLGGKGNQGIAAFVDKVEGTIGYVESAYAQQNKMAFVVMQNRDGNFVAPTPANVQTAAAEADWEHANGYYMVLTNQPGANAWPITGATFILLHTVQDRPKQALEVLKFFNWSYDHGDQTAYKLHYIPMPKHVSDMVRNTWKKVLKDHQGHTIWK